MNDLTRLQPTALRGAARVDVEQVLDDPTPRDAVALPLAGTLWSLTSPVWSGYVDFRDPHKYWTHWGFGTWTAVRPGAIYLVNDYDPHRHVFIFDEEMRSYVGQRADGVPMRGERLFDYVHQRR